MLQLCDGVAKIALSNSQGQVVSRDLALPSLFTIPGSHTKNDIGLDLQNALNLSEIVLANQQQAAEYKSEVIDLDSASYKANLVNVSQLAPPLHILEQLGSSPAPAGRKVNDRLYCNQKVFVKQQPNGSTDFTWMLFEFLPIEGQNSSFFNREPGHYVQHCLESPILTSANGSLWKLKLIPGVWPPAQSSRRQNSKRPSSSKVCLVAIPTHTEIEFNSIQRNVRVNIDVISKECMPSELPKKFGESAKALSFTSDSAEPVGEIILDEQLFRPPQGTAVALEHAYGQAVFAVSVRIDDLLSPPAAVAAAQREYNGLVNEGTTCYLNSLIQTLFFIRSFRSAIYRMPTEQQNAEMMIPLALQRIFYNLETGTESVRTYELLQAFGWN